MVRSDHDLARLGLERGVHEDNRSSLCNDFSQFWGELMASDDIKVLEPGFD
jgi:hypothetical protein